MFVDIFDTDKKYSIIYADPPWMFRVWNRDTGLGRSAESHYNTMTIDSICRLPIKDITTDDAVLFLWTTMPMLLDEAPRVIKAWGFEYKTCGFTWVKRNKKADSWFWGMGYWTRANAELCLSAVKGKPKRINAGVHSIIDSRIEEHSKKPDEVRNRIVKLKGDIPRIELFARQHAGGWDCWGDEVKEDYLVQSASR